MYVSTRDLMASARKAGTVIPAFNIPYLPMVAPVTQAIEDCNSVGLVMVARLEWEKFESRSLETVRDEYHRHQRPGHTRLHLDHVPVIDEDDRRVDYLEILARAVAAGPEPQGWGVLELASEDRARAICGLFQLGGAAQTAYLLRLRGLDAARRYRVTWDNNGQTCEVDGFTLTRQGVTIRLEGALTSELLMCEAV